MSMPIRKYSQILICLLAFSATLGSRAAENPFLGEWELTIPGGAAGWLGVVENNGKLEASIMWGSGSVLPLASAKVEGDRLLLTRDYQIERTDASGKKIKVNLTENITGSLNGDQIQLVSIKPVEDTSARDKEEHFSGRRQPPMPPAPDLSRVKFGKPIKLFDGKDLTGWRVTNPNAVNGWSVKDKLLVNNPKQEEGKPHKNYGNL